MTCEQKAKIINIVRRHDELVQKYNSLKSKWYSSVCGIKFKAMGADFKKIDDEFVSAVISSCRTGQMSPIQLHGFNVLKAAIAKAGTYIRVMPDETRGGGDFVAMESVSSADTTDRKAWFDSYMKLFPNLSIASGWRLTAMTERRYGGGSAVFFVTDDNGGFCINPLDRISISGDPYLGAIEATMFDFAISQIDLYWHSLYNKGHIVYDIPSLVQEYDVRNIISKITWSKDVWSFCDCDFSPYVSADNNDLYKVRYVKCHTWGGTVGFFEYVAEIKTNGFIGGLNLTSKPLYCYDSGIIF